MADCQLQDTSESGVPTVYTQPDLPCHHRPEIARAGNADAVSKLLKDFFKPGGFEFKQGPLRIKHI